MPEPKGWFWSTRMKKAYPLILVFFHLQKLAMLQELSSFIISILPSKHYSMIIRSFSCFQNLSFELQVPKLTMSKHFLNSYWCLLFCIFTEIQLQQSFQQLKFHCVNQHQLLHISLPGGLDSLQKIFLRLSSDIHIQLHNTSIGSVDYIVNGLHFLDKWTHS